MQTNYGEVRITKQVCSVVAILRIASTAQEATLALSPMAAALQVGGQNEGRIARTHNGH
jgi:hypothetical protein